MKIYLDVSCLNRPFDEQTQVRIRLEAEAVLLILERFDSGTWEQVSSEMVNLETDALGDAERKARVRLLFPEKGSILKLTEDVLERAAELQVLGFKTADAVHVAASERARADVFVTCDDRLCRLAKRRKSFLHVRVVNPVDWLKEIDDAANSG